MKSALITGSSRGIGRAIATYLANAGYSVVINYDKDEIAASKTVDEIRELGVEVMAIKADVSWKEDAENLINRVIDEWGHIDVLVNNAGILPNPRKIEEISDQEWERVMGINLKGAFYCSRAVVPHMKKRKSGNIVNISSVAGKEGGTVGAHYAASKAGMIGLTKALAKELAPYNIRVNAVAPGPVDTDFLPEELKNRLIKLSPLGRIAKPEEVAHAVLFLIENEHITGETVNVNGGRYMD
jgi:3-oxoacyl-[acyl-carrier protein] reductase